MTDTRKESLLWAATSACVSLAIIFGSTTDSIVSFTDIIRPLVILGITAPLITLALRALSPTFGRLFPVMLYSYFTFFNYMQTIPNFAFREAIAYIMLVIPPLGFHLILRYCNPLTTARYSLTATALVVLTTIVINAPSLSYTPLPIISEDFHNKTLATVNTYNGTTSELPDIIYLVPDRYPSAKTLIHVYDIDNSPFYAALKARGFEVAKNAHTNYPMTFQSLASTLNGGYLDHFTTASDINDNDRRPVYDAIKNNLAQDRLRSLGYRLHNYGNWWEPTRINPHADLNETASTLYNHLSEFERALLARTPTWNLHRVFNKKTGQQECHRIQRKMRLLEEVGNRPDPIFTFSHILIPHSPITMNASGQCLKEVIYQRSKYPWDYFKTAYIEYLRYFNTTVLRIIDRQLERRQPNGRPLLFVIQSDEGPYPPSQHDSKTPIRFTLLTQQDLQTKMGTLNALRLPSASALNPPDIATPINNWRIIYNELLQTGLTMLPHRLYIFPSIGKPYQHCDVTDFVTANTPPPSVPRSCHFQHHASRQPIIKTATPNSLSTHRSFHPGDSLPTRRGDTRWLTSTSGPDSLASS